ncbi:MAG: hypothetical protein JXA67_15035 [Micromonosporaceae bacterium]|nr:hypothetical protein [Micromonosporaceae bacterium]
MSDQPACSPRRWGRRLAKIRWAGAGLADQGVMGLANAGNTLLAAILLPRARASDLLLAAAVAYFAIGLNRAFVGDVLLALASRYDDDRRERLVRDGLCSAMGLGLLGMLAFAGVWAFFPPAGPIDLRDLIWLAPFLPMILLHDTGRYAYLSAQAPVRALSIDLVWITTQATIIIISVIVFGPSAPGLLIAWGGGASVGFSAFLFRERVAIWRGDPRRWLAQTRQLAGWFTATAVIAQTQTLAIGFLTGGLSKTALSGLRTAQATLLQPVQNVQLAVQGLLVPRLSRLVSEIESSAGEGRDPALGRFRHTVRTTALVFTGLGAAVVVVLWSVANLVLTRVDKFMDIVPLALPISLQAGIYLAQVPFTAALRGMHEAPLLFTQYALFTTVSLTGFVTGARMGDLTGAVWGLVTGSAVGLMVMVALYSVSTRRL